MSDSRHLLASFLDASDSRCPACGYALRGCTSARCPECGLALTLAISAGKPALSASWLAAVFGCSVSILIALILLIHSLQHVAYALQNPGLVQSVRAGFASSSEIPRWTALLAILAGLLIACAALAWLIARRRAFAAWRVGRRIVIGIVCLASPAVMLALIAWWIGG